MTVVARRFVSIPQRTAIETWREISRLLAPKQNSDAARELANVSGIASSLIAREAMRSAIVVYGSGPRVRIYCLYNDDAIEGDDASESSLAFDPTSGNWHISLPCPEEDLAWVQSALAEKSSHISARDMAEPVDEEVDGGEKRSSATVDLEAFFKS